MNVQAQVDRAIATAKRFGLTGRVTITRSPRSSFTPTTDARVAGSPLSFAADGASSGGLPSEPHTGGLEPQTSTIWTISASACTFEPQSGYTLAVNGKEYRVISVNPTEVGGVAVSYDIEVAR